MKTHRCAESLKQQVSIRHDKRYSFGDYEPVWNLRRKDFDWDCDWTGLTYCCEIKYCPFCGERLT